MNSVYGWWYQCSVVSRYRDLRPEHERRKLSSAVAGARHRNLLAIDDGSRLVLSLFTSMWEECGDCLWSAPRAVLAHALQLQVAEDDGAIVPVARWPPPLELVRSVCEMVVAIEDDDRDAAQQASQHIFFSVVVARPHSKKINLPHHVERNLSSVLINLHVRPGAALHDGSGFVCSLAPVVLDLSKVNLQSLMRHLVQWQTDEEMQPTLALPSPALSALQDIDARAGRLGILAREEGVEVWKPHGDSAIGQAEAAIARCTALRAFASKGVFASFAQDGYEADVFSLLVEQGVFSVREEFGELEFALGSTLRWTQRLRATSPLHALARPLHSDVAVASKIELLINLVREGWTWRDIVLDPVTPDGPRVISLAMISRSKKYLESLVECELLFSRGACSIEHQRPVKYYECLWQLTNPAILHAIPNADALTNGHYKQLLDSDGDLSLLPIGAVLDMDHDHVADDADDDAEFPLAILDVDGAAPPMVMPAVAAIGDVHAGPVAAYLRPVRWRGYTVRFDRWSHQSGQLRAYGVCNNIDHPACFRYTFTHKYSSRKELLSHLFCWCELGINTDRAEHQDRHLVIPELRRLQIEAELVE